MQTLAEALAWAAEQQVAIGHFNVSDSTQFHAIVDAATELAVPVIIGVSEGERGWIGTHAVAALVQSARADEKPVFLNADHTHDLSGIKEAVDAGFDEVLFDGSKLSLEENIAATKEAVAYAHEHGVLVEGELGYIGASSAVYDEAPEGIQKTDPEEARQFVTETGIDLFAPAVGNLHGMLKSGNPNLDTDLIARVSEAAQVPQVLHGASGNSDADIQAAIAAGFRIVHINTEIRVAYRQGIEQGLKEKPDEVAPYKYMAQGHEGVRQVVLEKLRVFNRL